MGPPDQPGAQSSQDPDGGETPAGLVIPLGKKQGQEDQQWACIGTEMGQIRMKEWREKDSGQSPGIPGENAPSGQGDAPDPFHPFDGEEQRDEGQTQVKGLSKSPCRSSCHGGIIGVQAFRINYGLESCVELRLNGAGLTA